MEQTSVTDALADMRAVLHTLYQGCVTTGEHFHPLSDNAGRFGTLALKFHAAADAIVSAVEHCHRDWVDVNHTTGIEQSTDTIDNPLRKYLHLSKDRLENQQVLEKLENTLTRAQDDFQKQVILTRARRSHQTEFDFQNLIQNLKKLAKELSEVTPLDFADSSEDPKSAQVTLGSHGEKFCFALVIDLLCAKSAETSCVQSASAFFLVNDGQWEDEDANADLVFCLQNNKFGRLKQKIRSMLETELVHDKYPSHATIPVKHMRERVTKFFKNYTDHAIGLALKQHLEGPALTFFTSPSLAYDQSNKLVFLGAREVPFTTTLPAGKELRLFLVQPSVLVPRYVAASLPSYFSGSMINRDNLSKRKPTSNSSLKYANYLSAVTSEAKRVLQLPRGSRVNLEVTPSVSSDKEEHRSIVVSQILLQSENLDSNFSQLVKTLRQYACFNHLLQSIGGTSDKGDRMDIDCTIQCRLTVHPNCSMLLSVSRGVHVSSLQLGVDRDSGAVVVLSSSGVDAVYMQKLVQSTLSIPNLIASMIQ